MEALDTLLPYKGLAVLSALALFMALGWLFPMARALGGLSRVGRNLSLAGVNAVLSWLVVVPVSAYAARYGLDWRPSWWAGWPGLVIDVLILDCWIYWWHRANHEIRFLWRFHEVHHLDEFLDSSSALRFHFGEVFLSSLVRACVIFGLGVPLTSVIVFETLLAVAAIFHHSNAKLPHWLEQPLSWVIVTPSIHWVHHHAIRRDTDSNYSAFLSLWDRLFGSRSPTIRTPEMPIGVEGRPERSIAGLLRRPVEGP
jgi:sterol desaturase/sphingolipid hydroxylase (fatty acid hydroxylase superfamily)